MTTQYTTILKLALPVQGELSGTWGDVVNDNITQMVEQAIAGKATVNSWTANSHTLTTADGTTSESRCAILELTDSGTALTGAGTVVCPTNTKLYIVDNNTAQIITVKTSGGTGVAVPVGKTMLVYCDGTNVVEGVTHANSLSLGTSTTTVSSVLDEDNMASDSATALATQQSIKAYVDSQVGSFDTLAEVLAQGNTTGGTDLAVSTGDDITFADNSKAIFGAGSDLQIYHDPAAGSIIQEGGSGSLFIRASTNIQLEGVNGENMAIFNENGSVQLYYDNVEKLATTTSGIDITGTATAASFETDAGGTFTTAAGNDLNIVYPAGRSLFIKEGSETHVTVDNVGNVGIGVSPGAKLDINISTNARGYFSSGIGEVGAGNFALQVTDATGATLKPLGFRAEDIRFATLGGERLRIDASGNVGIGVTPSAWGSLWKVSEIGLGAGFGGRTNGTQADVYENLYRDATNAYKYKTSAAASVYTQVVGNFVWSNAGVGTAGATATLTERMRIDGATGNVGIGTSTPAQQLHISGTGAVKQRYTRSANSTDISLASNGMFNADNLAATGFGWYNNGAEAMRIDASGNLLVGTTSAFGTTGTTINAAGLVYSSADGDRSGQFDRTTSDGEVLRFTKAGTTVGSILSSGGDGIIVQGVAAGSGLMFHNSDALLPAQNGNAIDATIDLGRATPSAFRFKDLYLSGTANMVGLIPSGAVTIGSSSYFIGNTAQGFRFNNAADTSNLMILKDSGDLLVGKTATSFSTAGSRLTPDGGGQFVVSGGAGVEINRLSSFGTILGLYKDDAGFGGISVVDSDPTGGGGELLVASGNTGLKFDDQVNYIRPANASGGNRDNIVDLGNSSNRFKDLYLSGGAYLGGTGAANKLEDYEEGTWTPAFANGGGSPTYQTSATNGTYTKIGNLVTFSAVITTTTGLTQSANGVRLTLPTITPLTDQSNFCPISVFIEQGFNPSGGAGNIQAITVSGTSEIQIYTIASTTGTNYTAVTYNDLNASSTNRIRFSGHYYA